MTKEQSSELTSQELRDLVTALGSEYRDQAMSEDDLRKRLARLGLNATEIDAIIEEAQKPT